VSAADAHHVLNLIDQARYTGRFTVHHYGAADLHTETETELATALSLADEWVPLVTHEDGGVAVQGGTVASFRPRWGVHVPVDLLDLLPSVIRDAIAALAASGVDA